ncbi:MAG: hypothetical protein ABSH48_01080 [Verrucomicrobiota bacterium]
MIDNQSELLHVVFLQEEPFFLQLKFAAQADSSDQPHFDLMIQRQIDLSGHFADRQFALSTPARVPLTHAPAGEIEFALHIHL